MGKHGAFSGQPITEWLTEDRRPDRRMKLLGDFWFIDPAGQQWTVPREYDRLDGASIPRALWTLVGSPYTGDYRRASIVHDHACDLAQGNAGARRAADRMFYHACREGGCSVYEATLLYIGVRIGAWLPFVAVWKPTDDSVAGAPRLFRTAQETQIQEDFCRLAERVIALGESDDPVELERRIDEAVLAVTGYDLQAY